MPARKSVKHKGSFRMPGSLRKSPGSKPSKVKKIRVRRDALRREFLQVYRTGAPRPRTHTVEPLFRLAGLAPIETLVSQRIRHRGDCNVFVVSPYKERAILDLKQEFGDKISVSGMDISARDPADPVQSSRHYIFGDVLKKPFPKSDIIFSTFSLGYIGNTGFMAKKVADALKEDGIAVLHVNTRGPLPKGPNRGKMGDLIKDPEKLKRNILAMKIPGCQLRIAEGDKGMPGFIIVISRPGSLAKKESELLYREQLERQHGPRANAMDMY